MFVQRDGFNDKLGCAEDRFEAAETFSNVGPVPIAVESPTDSHGTDGVRKSAKSGGDLPLDCWHHVVQHLNPPSLARAAAVGRTLRIAAYDDRLWRSHFEHTWSPEYCGSMQTPRDGKDFRQLCGQWWGGTPGAVDVFRNVHTDQVVHRPHCLNPRIHRRANGTFYRVGGQVTPVVNAVKLSRAGGLTAWSLGDDKDLVWTDLTTGRMITRFDNVTRPHGEGGGTCLAVLDSIGLVCVGGLCSRPVFGGLTNEITKGGTICHIGYPKTTVKFFSDVWDMIALDSPEGPGLPQLLTGGSFRRHYWRDEEECLLQLWDLRNDDAGPLRSFKRLGVRHGAIYSVALDPHHKRVFAGGEDGNIICWDFETGDQLYDVVGHQSKTCALVVGKDRLLSLCERGMVLEWDLQKFSDVGEEAEPRVGHVLAEAPISTGNGCGKINCMQGLGKGPAGVLAGTMDGRITLLGCQDQDLPLDWSLGAPLSQEGSSDVPVTCLAATDQVVVCGHSDGTLRSMRLDRPSGEGST